MTKHNPPKPEDQPQMGYPPAHPEPNPVDYETRYRPDPKPFEQSKPVVTKTFDHPLDPPTNPVLQPKTVVPPTAVDPAGPVGPLGHLPAVARTKVEVANELRAIAAGLGAFKPDDAAAVPRRLRALADEVDGTRTP